MDVGFSVNLRDEDGDIFDECILHRILRMPKIGDNIELIGAYFDYPLRVDWEHGAKGKITGVEKNTGLFIINLPGLSGINDYKFSAQVFRVLTT